VAVPAGSSTSPTSVSISAPSNTTLHAANGIVTVFSSTGCQVKTLASDTGYFEATFQ
jgi:hypothetical protein